MLKIGNKGIWKILAILIVFVLAMVVLMPSAGAVSESDGDSSSTTIYVPDSYPTIQAAVDAASPGDTIIVRDGTYRENIDVTKRLTIKSENGSVNCIVEAEDRDDNVFEITTNYVNISGFTVKDATGISSMQLNRADYCNISNNNVTGKGSNSFNGIHLSHSSNNIISSNNNYNNQHGIRLDYSSNNTIKNNDNRDNLIDGIALFFSSNNNTITSNNNYNCESNFGIYIFSSSRNTIENNNNHANARGIYLNYASNNIISNNANTNNSYGIYLQHHSSNNKIYLNNFINNTDNVCTHNSTNIWNSKDAINYSYNGSRYTNYIGNYWDDYTGNDTDDDGMGDIHYCIYSDKDNYPLIQPWENYFVEENGTNTKSETPKFAFSSYYQPINILVNLSVPPYQLPLNLSNITNIEDITAKLGLNKTEEDLLGTNGFVILDYGQEDDIVAPYKDMKERGIPIFVTTDTLLHLYHIQFNEILKGIEEREFFDALVDMSNAMLEQSVQDYETFDDADMKESARRNVAYFAVALKLLQTATEGYNGTEYIKVINSSIPDYVIEDVNKELENIAQHDGFHPSAIFNSNPNCICDYPCCYCEDYSQYVPRGHYTRSEQLKRYFNAMMWYGRIAFMLKGCNGDDALISEQDANRSTIQAALIASELPDVAVNNSTAQEIWDRIYSVTAFFVGTADDLTPYEYRDAQNIVFGTAYNASDLSDEDKLLELKVELAKLRSPEIYGGSGICVVYPPITEAKLYVCLNETKG
ncbi:Cell surface glycoprotein, partial [ANME-1 cluster archaeon GoMg3.2]|nr:Cell surface glycoprotein [ANME-1 cluster archaeon GoMg3.2]